MALAKFRKVGDKIGSGRFVVSEGVAPSAYLLPHENLPTLGFDEEDDRFEVVIKKGTILSLVQNAAGDSRIVPANGSGAGVTYADGLGGTVVVPANSVPIGCAQYNLYRPFDRGTSQGAGWITHGYVEWPMIQGVNDDLNPGDIVISDDRGRPVKGYATDPDGAGALVANANVANIVGKVIEVEEFGVNYDTGLLEYMEVQTSTDFDTGTANEELRSKLFTVASAGPHQGFDGARVNLDVPNVVGAVRVTLTI